MSYQQKYLKYKKKYLQLNKSSSNIIKFGGAPYNKTILLSCNEFNDVVDKLISLDSVNGPINLNSTPIDISKNSYEEIKKLDSQTSDININDSRFNDFLDDIASKIDTLDKQKKDLMKGTIAISEVEALAQATEKRTKQIKDGKYLDIYMRKMNNYESTNFFRGFINWRKYPDATPDIKMNKRTVSKLNGAKIVYFAYFSFNEKDVTPIIDQLLFLNSLSHYGVSEINIVLPYFPVGTMERIVGEGEIPTGYSLAHMLNTIPNGGSKNKIYILDIHALCSRFFFHSNTIPILLTMMNTYIKHIKENYKKPDDLNIIVFPDDGAKKRYDKLVPTDIKKILCTKTRILDKRIVKIDEGIENLTNIDGSLVDKNINLFLIDDLVQSGGTILETFKGIHKELCNMIGYNREKIKYIPLITHSVFPDVEKTATKFFGEIREESKNIACTIFKIDQFITTNSRPTTALKIKEIGKETVSIIDIANVFFETYTDINNNTRGNFSIRDE